METWPLVNFQYDGTFAGFLTCVYDSLAYHEEPAAFFTPLESRISFYPTRTVETHPAHAKQVYASWKQISPLVQELAATAFLTCLPERELRIWQFIMLARQVGAGVTHWLTDDRVDCIYKAVKHLHGEAHLLKGFTRFADYGAFLGGRIQPKNRVLPLLRPHFCQRFNTEHFVIYDETHFEALFYRPNEWVILPLESLELPPISDTEADYQALWKGFYKSVSIEGRYNPKLRQTNVPKRYWKNMTELSEELGARS